IDQASEAYTGEGAAAASSPHSKTFSGSNDGSQSMRFDGLQGAAERLAYERLAKLEQEIAQNQDYRDYYGTLFHPKPKLFLRGRLRHRASSDEGLDEDREQSQKIR